MSLYGSFYSSLSGLTANANALSVIGNNLANLNTAGFKGSSSEFQDLFNAAIANQGTQGNGNPMQVGLGASLGSVAADFAQVIHPRRGAVSSARPSSQPGTSSRFSTSCTSKSNSLPAKNRTSARSGEGVDAWIAWILAQSAALAD